MAKPKKYKGEKHKVVRPFVVGKKRYDRGDEYVPTSEASKQDLINKKRIEKCQ